MLWGYAMISIDESKCCYCGGCVSLCPADALYLAETRLHVREDCLDCGDCIVACPTGALSLTPAPVARQQPCRRSYDVVVVGSGPAGATAARFAAERGLSVLLVDRRQEIGSPVQCAEGVGHEMLAPFIEPDARWISATIRRARIVALGHSRADMTLGTENAIGYVLERRVFDRVLAERAVAAGTEVMVKTQATGLLWEDSTVRGVQLVTPTGQCEVEAKIVIGADGVGALIGRWGGLDTRLPARDLMTCAQYLLAGIDIDPECTCYYIGEQVAPGGYAWIFPKGERRANVGLGVQADLAKVTPLEYLNRFIADQRTLAQGYPVSLIVGGVPVALTPGQIVSDGLMLVGDAARQVDPLTGGGITSGMSAGRIAAEVASEAIAAGNTSAAFLRRYEARWAETLGRKMVRNYRLRERFPPGKRDDSRFLQVFAMAVGGTK